MESFYKVNIRYFVGSNKEPNDIHGTSIIAAWESRAVRARIFSSLIGSPESVKYKIACKIELSHPDTLRYWSAITSVEYWF